jgi:hypothetical protein
MYNMTPLNFHRTIPLRTSDQAEEKKRSFCDGKICFLNLVQRKNEADFTYGFLSCAFVVIPIFYFKALAAFRIPCTSS